MVTTLTYWGCYNIRNIGVSLSDTLVFIIFFCDICHAILTVPFYNFLFGIFSRVIKCLCEW